MIRSRILQVTQWSLALFAGAAFFAAVIPDVRAGVRNSVLKDFRTVISTAQADLAGDGTMVTIAKIKTRNNIYIEVFSTLADGITGDPSPHLVERVELSDSRDAFFNFDGQATNLAIEDIDGDGKKEILVPTFDKNLVGRLNIFSFSDATHSLTRLNQSTL